MVRKLDIGRHVGKQFKLPSILTGDILVIVTVVYREENGKGDCVTVGRRCQTIYFHNKSLSYHFLMSIS